MTNNKTNTTPIQFKDDLDKWLFDNFLLIGGCCSSYESAKYNVAREIAEKAMEYARQQMMKDAVDADIMEVSDDYYSTPHTYALYLTERQAKLLSYACDQFSRLICGQDSSFQDLMETAWEKRCKEATGDMMDDTWDGGWHAMRHEAEDLCKQIKKRFWGLDRNALYGVHYDETADILFDLHQVIRHQLWLDRPADKKSTITVDASEAMAFSDEPLAKIERIERIKLKEL